MSKKIDKEPLELLEEPLLKAPHELMRRNHRAAQRQVEKDFSFLQTTLKGLQQSLAPISPQKPTAEDILSKLSTAEERVGGLKRKLSALQPSTDNPSVLGPRLAVIQKLETVESSDTPEWSEWSQTRLDRYIVEYLLRTGKFETAQAYAQSKGIEQLADSTLLIELARIEDSLVKANSCTEALSWCGENRGGLKKSGNYLEFSLRLQEYIELCRKRDPMAALTYMRKYLAGWKESHLAEIVRCGGMMVVGEGAGYDDLYNPFRWDLLRSEFRKTFLSTYSLPSQPLLSLTLFSGLSSLKLSACLPPAPTAPSSEPPVPLLDPSLSEPALGGTAATEVINPSTSLPLPTGPASTLDGTTTGDAAHAHLHAEQRNLDCPTCSPQMEELVKHVPFSHHVNSTIVCRISGEVMDESNWPMALPNGRVYSYKALDAMAKENHGVVTCPRTGDQVLFERLLKVFIS